MYSLWNVDRKEYQRLLKCLLFIVFILITVAFINSFFFSAQETETVGQIVSKQVSEDTLYICYKYVVRDKEFYGNHLSLLGTLNFKLEDISTKKLVVTYSTTEPSKSSLSFNSQ